jgi:hypothetical protein
MPDNTFYGAGVNGIPLNKAVDVSIAASALVGVGTPEDPNKLRVITPAEVVAELRHPIQALGRPAAPGQTAAKHNAQQWSTGVRIGLALALIVFTLAMISAL